MALPGSSRHPSTNHCWGLEIRSTLGLRLVLKYEIVSVQLYRTAMYTTELVPFQSDLILGRPKPYPKQPKSEWCPETGLFLDIFYSGTLIRIASDILNKTYHLYGLTSYSCKRHSTRPVWWNLNPSKMCREKRATQRRRLHGSPSSWLSQPRFTRNLACCCQVVLPDAIF